MTAAPIPLPGYGVVIVYGDITERKRLEQDRRENEANVGALIENTDGAIWSVDTRHGLIAANHLFQEHVYPLFGRRLVLGDDVLAHPVPPAARAEWQGYYQRALAGERFQTETWTRFRETTGYVEYRFSPIVLEDGTIRGVTVFERDMTDRVRAEQALRESEARYRFIAENTADVIWTLDPVADRFTYVSPSVEKLRGYTAEEVLAQPISAALTPASLKTISADLAQNLPAFTAQGQGFRSFIGEVNQPCKNGRVVQTEVTTTYVFNERGQVTIVGVSRDITERKRRETEIAGLLAQVQAANAELHQLSRRLLAVQEEERRHIGRELHDEVGQALTGALLMLDMLAESQPGPSQPLQQARSMIWDLASRVRDLSLELRPSILDDLGLLPALAWHLERYTGLTQVRVDFRHAGLQRRFPRDVETAAYRIVQEALTNVARHARVSEVGVNVWADADQLYAHIEDHGVGFREPNPAQAPTTGGLAGMRERARLLDGDLTLTSQPGAGTIVEAVLPLCP